MMNDERKQKKLEKKTKDFSLQIIHNFSLLPKTAEAQIIGRQLLRSGTSVGAHYRIVNQIRVVNLFSEIEELTAIFVASVKTAKQRK